MSQHLTDCRAAIVAAIEAALKTPLKLRTVEAHRGRLTGSELKRLGTRAPAVLLGCLGWSALRDQAGETEANVTWVATIVTKDAPDEDRGTAAVVIANAVGGLVMGNTWGLEAQYATGIQARNLYAGDVDMQGVALWTVSWQQWMTIALDGEFDPANIAAVAALGDLITVHAEHYDPGGIAAGEDPRAIDEVTQ
ncbi:MAG: phage protein Gp37 [Pseudomonadota bacterium]